MKIYKINEKNWYAEKPSITYEIIREMDDQMIYNGGSLKIAIQKYYYCEADEEKCYILKHTTETISAEQAKDQLDLEEKVNKFNI